jgi:hypothetical protein
MDYEPMIVLAGVVALFTGIFCVQYFTRVWRKDDGPTIKLSDGSTQIENPITITINV